MFEHHSSPAFIQVEQQNQRHEVARLSQFIFELEHHVATIHSRLAYLGQTLSTQEQRLEYAQLLLQMNSGMATLQKHRETLQAMLAMTGQGSFGKQIPDQCRREIYHLYQAGRYTQDQLAGQYAVSQSAVSKIVNGPAPGPIGGLNPQGVAR